MSSTLLKNLATIAGLLLLLMAVYLYRQVPHAKIPFAKASMQAQHLLLEKGAKKVDLQKQGSSWKVVSADGSFSPAEDNQIQTLLSDLDNVQIEDEISDRPDRAADFDVTAGSGTHLKILGAQGASLGEGIFGKQAPDFAHIYFRYIDRPQVYLARGLIRTDLGVVDFNFWRNHQLINIPETKIQAITMEGKGFKTELVRTSTDVWTVNGKKSDAAPINALIGTLAHLRCTGFVDAAANPKLTYGALKNAHVVVKGSDSRIELRIGPQDATTKQFPVSVGPDAGLAWLPGSVVSLLQQKPSAFSKNSL